MENNGDLVNENNEQEVDKKPEFDTVGKPINGQFTTGLTVGESTVTNDTTGET